jgi:hypothetical protein
MGDQDVAVGCLTQGKRTRSVEFMINLPIDCTRSGVARGGVSSLKHHFCPSKEKNGELRHIKLVYILLLEVSHITRGETSKIN